jgi:hypothetical protein
MSELLGQTIRESESAVVTLGVETPIGWALSGCTISNGRWPKNHLRQLFNSKLGCTTIVNVKRIFIHSANSRVENSAQFSIFQEKFVHGSICVKHRDRSVRTEISNMHCQGTECTGSFYESLTSAEGQKLECFK